MSTRATRFRALQRAYARAAGVHGLGQPPDVHSGAIPMPPAIDADEDLIDKALGPDPLVQEASAAKLPLWLYPPENFENIDQAGYVALPALNTTGMIISFQVPIGRNGMINKVANNFVGGGWVEGTGDVIWRILVDGTPPPGATSYNNIVNSLGSPANPTGIPGFRIFENQVITVVAFNNPLGPNGGVVVAGQLVGARLVGYLYPRELEQGGIWV